MLKYAFTNAKNEFCFSLPSKNIQSLNSSNNKNSEEIHYKNIIIKWIFEI